jgi:hypothetical protein
MSNRGLYYAVINAYNLIYLRVELETASTKKGNILREAEAHIY